jgi:molecular chaperone GrpE
MHIHEMSSAESPGANQVPLESEEQEPVAQSEDTEKGQESATESSAQDHAAIRELLEQLGAIRSLTDEMVSLANSREETIGHLYEENRRLRAGELKQALKSTVNDLIRLYDMIRDLGVAWRARECLSRDEICRELSFLSECLLDILSRQSVRPFRADQGEAFDPKLHCAVRSVSTASRELDRTVHEIVTEGFLWDDRVVRFLGAEVYVLAERAEPPKTGGADKSPPV